MCILFLFQSLAREKILFWKAHPEAPGNGELPAAGDTKEEELKTSEKKSRPGR